MSSGMHLEEEGIEQADIHRSVRKNHSVELELQQMINDFRHSDDWDEFGQDAQVRLLGNKQSLNSLSTEELKQALKKKIQQRNSLIKKINRKSRLFIEDSFLKFHLLENALFYAVMFSVPMLSVINCTEGHSPLSYFAIGAFMLCIFFIDLINLSTHIKKERLKLSTMNFYGRRKNQKQWFELLKIYFMAVCELFLTQLNILDIYTDFMFLTICYIEKELTYYFVLSLCSFVLIMIPKLISFFIILRILCSSRAKITQDPLLDKNESVSSVYDEDTRRKLIFRAFTFSEFRSQALCVDYIGYEIYKTEYLMSAAKFLIEDVPQFIL